MVIAKRSNRVLKDKIFELLRSADFDMALEELYRLPARQVINPLFSFLYSGDPETKWAAVTAMGGVVAKLANKDIEAARVIIRRLMWNLNDESGGIGWGSSEAMGEILACHKRLAEEYISILISYTREDGNYLEHEILQRGVLWGIGRVSQVRPHLVRHAVPFLMPYLESGDATVRALTSWIMGLIGIEEACPVLEHLTKDRSEVQLYLDRKLIKTRVNDLAAEALRKCTLASLQKKQRSK